MMKDDDDHDDENYNDKMTRKWGCNGNNLSRPLFLPEEAYIADLDAKSGASLKLTILNKSGRIWTMVAGGGASVIYRCCCCCYRHW